jgi:hypothetical protein
MREVDPHCTGVFLVYDFGGSTLWDLDSHARCAGEVPPFARAIVLGIAERVVRSSGLSRHALTPHFGRDA